MTYTQKPLGQIPPPTIRLFVCLSIISAIGIMGLALVTYSHHEDVERPNVHRFQQSPAGTDHSKSEETLAEMIGETRPRVSFFMNRFRKLGLIDYNGSVESTVHF
jgi:CRP-like cAMP-binding protein